MHLINRIFAAISTTMIVFLLSTNVIDAKEKTAIDVVLVICNRPYYQLRGTHRDDYPFRSNNRGAATGTDGLRQFVTSFSKKINGIDSLDARLAVIKAYRSPIENGYDVKMTTVVDFNNGRNEVAIEKSLKDVAIDVVGREGANGCKRIAPELRDHGLVDGDRSYAPNLIVLVAIGSDEDRTFFGIDEITPDKWSDVKFRIFARDFATVNAPTNYSGTTASQLAHDITFINALDEFVADFEEIFKTCAVIEENGVCFYRNIDGRCESNRLFKVVEESVPKGFCTNGLSTVDCATSECEKLCDESEEWSKCDCEKGAIEQEMRRKKPPHGTPVQSVEYCRSKPPRKCKCDYADSSSRLSAGAVAGIVIAVFLVIVISVSIAVFVLYRRWQARRRLHGGGDRGRAKDRKGRDRGDDKKKPSPSRANRNHRAKP